MAIFFVFVKKMLYIGQAALLNRTDNPRHAIPPNGCPHPY